MRNYPVETYPNLTYDQAKMLSDMSDHSEKRLAGWEVVLLDRFPYLVDIKTPTILGMFAWTQNKTRTKMILRSHAVDYGVGWCTPADIARDYLAVKYPNRRVRMTTSQYEKCVIERVSAPLYCRPCVLDDAVYVDIKSAYWSIVRSVGWDVNYNPGRILGQGEDNRDFPLPKIKMARNCLVSCGLSGGIRIWTGEELITQNRGNRFVNYLLWRLVQDVLNGVCHDAVEAGAVYCYTDGYIVPRKYVQDVEAAIAGWGLESGWKHEGECIVRAPADYKFPDYETKLLGRRIERTVTKYYDPNINWLRWRFREFAKDRRGE